MQTVRMSEDIFTEMRYWLKQNKIDGISFDIIDDRYLKVTLTKETDVKTWRISRVIDVMDFYRCYPWDYFEDMAKQFNDDVKKTEEEE